MNKQEFLARLRARLAGLPKEDVEERLAFYEEMIDDRVEEGISEEEAVAGIGETDEIAQQIIREVPLTRIAKERMKRRRPRKGWEILLLALGSPLWIPLLAAALVVVLALAIAVWSLVISLWAIFVSLAASGFAVATVGVGILICGSAPTGLTLIGGGICCVGLSILLFFGCVAGTKGTALLTGGTVVWIKKLLVGKEKTV